MSDWVFITAGGGRWHRRQDCEALEQGQLDARQRGLSTHPIRHMPRASAEDRVACGWCAGDSSTAATMPVDSALRQLRTDTEYERLFLDRVLGSLPELSEWTIRSQHDITVAGRTYRVDFALIDGPDRIAVEIDGEHKGPGALSHEEWTRRQTALVADGWEVLRFTNRDVRDQQESCRRHIAVAVARLRERRRHAAAPRPVYTAPPPSFVETAPDRSSLRTWGWVLAAVAGLLIALAALGDNGDTTADQAAEAAPVTSAPGETLDPRYSSCKEAMAAGYGPYQKGRDEEYAWYKDGDQDGVVCEPYRH